MYKQTDEMEDRIRELAKYLIEEQATVRRAASVFNISKSTVHKDISIRLREIDPSLFEEANKILQLNKKERHIRGGQATKMKYLFKKETS